MFLVMWMDIGSVGDVIVVATTEFGVCCLSACQPLFFM